MEAPNAPPPPTTQPACAPTPTTPCVPIIYYLSLPNDPLAQQRRDAFQSCYPDIVCVCDAYTANDVPEAFRLKFGTRDKDPEMNARAMAIAYSHLELLRRIAREAHPHGAIAAEDDCLLRVPTDVLAAIVATAPYYSATLLGGQHFNHKPKAEVQAMLAPLPLDQHQFLPIPYDVVGWYGQGAIYYPPGVAQQLVDLLDRAPRVNALDCFVPKVSKRAYKKRAVPIVQHFVWPAPFDHNDVLASHHYSTGVGLVRNYVKTSARGAKKRAEAEAAREGVWRVHGKPSGQQQPV